MTRRTQLSAQVHLVEAAEHLQQAQKTLGEGAEELGGELDTIISDVEIASGRSDGTDRKIAGRWYERQSTHN